MIKETVEKLHLGLFSRIWYLSLNMILVFLMVSILVPVQQVYASGNIYYVAKNGSDSNVGSEAEPFLTIQHAVNKMASGDTTYVRTGVYYEQVIFKPRTSYTYLKNYPGESPIIDGTGVDYIGWYGSYTGILFSYHGVYWDIEGFEIQNGINGSKMIAGIAWFGDGNGNIVVRNCKTHDTNWSGIYFGNCSKILIDNCETYYTNISGMDESLDIVGCNGFEISNCKVHDTLGEANYPSSTPHHKEGITIKGGSSNGTIHHNEVYNCMNGIAIDTYSDGTENIQIFNNLVYENDSDQISISSESGNDISNISIYNNIIIQNDVHYIVGVPISSVGLSLGWKNTGLSERITLFTNIKFYNNTIYGSNIYFTRPIFIQGANYESIDGAKFVNCSFINNIVDCHLVTRSHSAITLSGVVPSIDLLIDNNLIYTNGFETGVFVNNAILSNPLFVNPGADFRLQSGSPAIDNSSSTLIPTADFAGNPRPQGAGNDIGAYEYVNTTPILDHIIVSPSDHSVAVGETQTYSAQGYDISSNPISSLTYTWIVTNPTAGTIDSSGLFTAGTMTGTYSNVIYAVSGNKNGVGSVTITAQQYDINRDVIVNVLDMILVNQHQGESGYPGWINEDVNADGVISVLDVIDIVQHLTE